MYAVIKTGGKQYRVAENDTLEIERLAGEAGDIIEFKDVLMIGSEAGIEVGTPVIEGATVAAELVEQFRGKKILIFKKKRRKHYRRKNGHRQDLTRVCITEILSGGKKPSKKATAKTETKKETKADAKPAKKTAKAKATPATLFDAPAGDPDDLKKISGVGPALEKKLHNLGITKYAQVAAFSADDITKIDDALSFKGRIERDDWVSQAKALANGE